MNQGDDVAFLPFNITKQKKLKIIIIGAGYAGIAALTTLARFAPDTNITIIDPRQHHIKTTHLHETFRYPLEDVLVSFRDIENRFGCRHIAASIHFTHNDLEYFQQQKQLPVQEEFLDFDYLVVATGNPDRPVQPSEDIVLLKDFETSSGSDLISKSLNKSDQSNLSISVVGGGATGIQFLFELKHFLNRIKSPATLRLIHSKDRVLESFPIAFNDYIQSRMQELDIAFHPYCYFQQQQSGHIHLKNKLTQQQITLPSMLSLLFLGKQQQDSLLANVFGQVMFNNQALQNIFTAGDNSSYESIGTNAHTAQSAVRKGKLVARNILRHAGFPGLLEPYIHQDLGYVIHLGPHDAVGWLGMQNNIMTGMPALAIKEIVEAQYDLLLSGIDTYVV